MNYDRAAMKEEVKLAMRQTRPSPMLVTLLLLVVVGAGTGLVNWLAGILFSGRGTSLQSLLIGIMMNGGDLEDIFYYYPPQFLLWMMIQSMAVSLTISILTTVWSGLMDAGYAGYCLDMSQNMSPPMERIFGGFSRAGAVIGTYILVAVFTALWSMLFGLALVAAIAVLSVIMAVVPIISPLILLLMLAAYVGFFIGIFWAVLRYAMVPFVVIDSRNNLSAMDAIRCSKALMQGRKGSYFVLQLSFIGWYLLEYLVVLAGFIIVVVISVGSIFSGDLEYFLYSIMMGDPDEVILPLVQMLGPALLVALLVTLVCGAGIFVINLWLTPYRTGCNARFYIFATGGQPIQPYGGQPPYNGGQPPYGGGQAPYNGGQPPYGGGQAPYGGQSGPYNSGPYGYTPPSQSSFGGYTQVEQPLQHGTGIYSQWGAPQAPQIPTAPQAPQVPAAPAAPSAAPASAEIPAEPDDALYEAPYAPEALNDDTPRKPGGPSYPQY